MRNHIGLDLGDGYLLETHAQGSVITVSIFKGEVSAAKATLVTDHVDVACVTNLNISDAHANHLFPNQRTLSEVLIKFIFKLPYNSRKLEFRFILDFPENLRKLIENKKFDQGKGSLVENEILVRKENLLPPTTSTSCDFEIRESRSEAFVNSAFELLKRNAYWRGNSTAETFSALTRNSRCFYAVKDEKVIGFARVLTDDNTFASLWDVAVDEDFRRQGIATAIMHRIFGDEKLAKATHWVLFTDTAKSLYQKFGFASESEFPNRTLVHKLRLQEQEPVYMAELRKTIDSGIPTSMTPEKSHEFLFGASGKRAGLSQFWKSFSASRGEELSAEVCSLSK